MRRLLCLLALFVVLGSIGSAQLGTQPGDGSFPILFTIDLDIPDARGLGHDGVNFWVADANITGGQCLLHIVDEYGGLVTSFPQGGGAIGQGCRDLTFNGTYMFGSYSMYVDGYGSNYQYVGSFLGCPIDPNRLLEYAQGHFYTCGFGTDLYRMTWDGVWGTAATCEQLGFPVPDAKAMAYDDLLPGMWVITGAHDLLRWSWGGGGIDSFTVSPEYEQVTGCTMAHTRFGYVLAVLVEADPAALLYYDLGYATSSSLTIVDRGLGLELRVLPSVLLAGNGQVGIAFQVPRRHGRDRVDLTIFDAAGRLVAAQSMPVPDRGRGRFAWDGHDAGGRLQPSGIYQVRAQAGSQTGEARLLILR